jgi:hypothetical protein
MCIRNTIPLPVSVVPMLKYYIRNIVGKLLLSFFFNMSYKASKYKQRIILSETIKSYGIPIMLCSNYVCY